MKKVDVCLLLLIQIQELIITIEKVNPEVAHKMRQDLYRVLLKKKGG